MPGYFYVVSVVSAMRPASQNYVVLQAHYRSVIVYGNVPLVIT